MEAFATWEEFTAYLRKPVNSTASAEFTLAQASAAVRGEVRQVISLVEDDVVILDGRGSNLLALPETPVHDVASVFVDGDQLDGDSYEWNTAGLLRRRPARAVWPDRWRSVVVTYTHGWASDTPQYDLARQITLQAAARRWVNPGIGQSQQVGGITNSVGSSAGTGVVTLTELERSQLRATFRP